VARILSLVRDARDLIPGSESEADYLFDREPGHRVLGFELTADRGMADASLRMERSEHDQLCAHAR
jgi:hypothetical protein